MISRLGARHAADRQTLAQRIRVWCTASGFRTSVAQSFQRLRVAREVDGADLAPMECPMSCTILSSRVWPAAMPRPSHRGNRPRSLRLSLSNPTLMALHPGPPEAEYRGWGAGKGNVLRAEAGSLFASLAANVSLRAREKRAESPQRTSRCTERETERHGPRDGPPAARRGLEPGTAVPATSTGLETAGSCAGSKRAVGGGPDRHPPDRRGGRSPASPFVDALRVSCGPNILSNATEKC